MRDDINVKVESSPSMGTYIRNNLKKTYFCILLIILIEIVFCEFMETMTDFLADLLKTDIMDSQYMAYLILMVVNFLLLSVPTYALIKSIKGIDNLVMSGERMITKEFSEEKAKKAKPLYERVLNFSTIALIFIIDFLIMAVVPGPFGAEKSSLIAIPIAILIFVISYVISRRRTERTMADEE